MNKRKRILISVTDKTGIEKFKKLVDTGNWEIISTGGTAKTLIDAGIPCIPIEEVTGFPEMMDGRLKTLHPNIFGGILADRDKPQHLEALNSQSIGLIDVVAVNLYDFDHKPGIENIDIGGPSLLRAAAKNGAHTIPLVDPDDYESVIDKLLNDELDVNMREYLVMKVFKHTAEYDRSIYEWMVEKQAGEAMFLKPIPAEAH